MSMSMMAASKSDVSEERDRQRDDGDDDGLLSRLLGKVYDPTGEF